MVKKKVGGGKRFKAAQGQDGEKPSAPAKPQPPPPKHLQRKITKKVGFLDKVASSQAARQSKVAGLGATPTISKNSTPAKRKQKATKAFSSLQSLAGPLSEVERELQQLPAKKRGLQQHRRQFGQAVNSSRAREVVTVKESERIQQVLRHPVFKANPLQAITNHLQATMPPAPPPESHSGAAKSKQQAQKKKKAKAAKEKEVASGQDGDVVMS